jgi:restriction system protein
MIDEEYYDPSQQALIASWEEQRTRAAMTAAAIAAGTIGDREEYVPDFPTLVSQAVIIPYQKTDEGQLIKSATVALLNIIERVMQDPSRMYEIDPRKWEEIIAGTYAGSGLFDEVTLTPRSGDRGQDVIAVKRGFGSVRIIESVKRYTPGTKVTAEEVQALLGVLHSDPQASKGIVSTTWEFAPKIQENPNIKQYIPHRLELVDGEALLKRLKEYTRPKSK